MSGPDLAAVAVEQLTAALGRALDVCGDPLEYDGANLPELLRAALEQLARDRGGSQVLIAHRPGSWEAEHVQALAAGADPW